MLSAEGTEQVRQQEKQVIFKVLNGIETLSEAELQALELTNTQKSYLKRLRSTLARLDNPTSPRPSVNLYQGNPLITVSISLSPDAPLTACVVDIATGKTLDCQTTKQLLTVQGINKKRGKRSILQLKLERWRLINKLHLKRQLQLKRQAQEQKQGNYRATKTESYLGLYVERALASKLVRLVLKWQAVLLFPI